MLFFFHGWNNLVHWLTNVGCMCRCTHHKRRWFFPPRPKKKGWVHISTNICGTQWNLRRGVLARGRVTSTSYELTRIRYNWWELGTKMANFVLSCQIVLIPYLIPRFSHNHQEIFTIVPYSTLIPEAIFHQEGYCRNCTVFHLVFPRLTHIFLYIFIVKYIHNILSLIPY